MLLAALLALLLLALAWHATAPLQRWRLRALPGPRPLPFLGNTLALSRGSRSACLDAWARQYGPVYKIWLGPRPVVVVADAETMRELCVRRAHAFPSRTLPETSLPPDSTAARGVPLSMAFCGGAYWRALRSSSTPLFQPVALAAAAPSMCTAAAELVDAVVSSCDNDANGETDIHALLSNTTLDVIGACALGAPMGAQRAACGKGSAPLAAAALTVFQCLEPLSGDGRVNDHWALLAALSPRFTAPLWRLAAVLAPAAAVKRLHVADDYVRAAAQRLLAAARAAIADGSAAAPGAPPSLFGVLAGSGAAAAAARHGIPPLTDEQIVAQAHTFLLAGAETTASALACAVYLLVLHPHAAARVRAEADAAFAHVATPPPLSALPYTGCVLQEAMRLLPPVSLLNRHAAEGTSLAGYAIPKGTSVLVTLTAIMHSPAHFPDPLAFRPERFLPGGDGGDDDASAAATHPLAWAPFGAGPRQCLGARFAAQETALALARLTRDVDVSLPCGARPLRLREGITNAPADGLRVRATRRQRAHSHAA